MTTPPEQPTTAPPARRDARVATAVVLSLGFSTFGVGMSLPVVTFVASDLTSSAVLVGAVVATRWVARLALNIPAGMACQRRGAWVVFLVGVAVVGLSGVLSALAYTWPLLLLARVVEGAGAALSMTAGMAMIVGVSDSSSRGKLFGHYQMGQRIGFWIGPLAGGLVAGWAGNRAALWGYAIIALLAVVPLALTGPPASPTAAPATVRFGSEIRTLLGRPEFMLIGVVTFVAFFTMTGLQFTALPVLVDEELHLGPEVVGWAIFASNAVSFALVYPSAWASDRISRRGTVAVLLLVGGLGLLTLPLVHDVATLMAASVVTASIHVLRGPATQAYAADAAGTSSAGAAAALYRSLGDLGSVAGPFAVGFLLAFGTDAFFLVNAGLAGIALVAFLVGTRPRLQLGVAS
jgi:MFS family permease